VPETAKAAGYLVLQTRDDIRKAVNPMARAEAAERAGYSLREHSAQAAQSFVKAEYALRAARKVFARRTWPENLDFINAVESGEIARLDGELRPIAEAMRVLLDRAREDVQALGTGKLQKFYETYFPHIWKRPEAAIDEWKRILGRRPIEGTKSFLKKRKFESFQEGVDAGLEPVSENPVDLVLLKLREMYRYTAAHRFLREMRRLGLAKFVPVRGKLRKPPDGWTELPDPIGTVWGNPVVQVPEAVDREMFDGLMRVAERLGINVKTLAKMRGSKWGYAFPEASLVRRRFAGPESVLMHEIGHVLDTRYGLADILVKAPQYKQELRALADLRVSGNDKDWFERYTRRADEKIANMVAAYVHTRARMRQVAPATFRWFDHFVRTTPELAGLAELEYGMQLDVHKTGIDTGGLLLRGHWYMPAEASHLVKNFLSPGLGGKAWYKVLRTTANSMLQFALGFSGFHFGFTSMDAATSKLALAAEYAAQGQGGEAAKKAAGVLAAPVTNIIAGDRLLKAYVRGAADDPELAKLLEGLVMAGGRAQELAQNTAMGRGLVQPGAPVGLQDVHAVLGEMIGAPGAPT
jgi:hypothetical protein